MDDWMRLLAGRFIVFDGPDGSGKSTQFARIGDACEDAGLAVCRVREPGGTHVGERIRAILLDPDHDEMSVRSEMLLYMASRAQLVAEVIGPALGRGELVLADRFISSTLAYQGTAGGLPVDDILAVGRIALGDVWPDLNIIFDVDETVAAGRRDPDPDRMEQKGADYHRRVRAGYLDQAARDPERYVVIDASADTETVTQRTLDALRERLGARA
jgi:dTMP kinase